MILLDTHALLWLAGDAERLSEKARRALHEARAAGESIAISAITLYEVSFIATYKRVRLHTSLEHFLAETESRFDVLPITRSACLHAMGLGPNFPRDPVDRIITGTALAEGRSLVTADGEITRSGVVSVIW